VSGSSFGLGLTTENGEWIRLRRGSPLLLHVWVSNTVALLAADSNAAIDRSIAAAQDQLEDGTITKAEFDLRVAQFEKRFVEPTPETLGSQDRPWWSSLQFVRMGDGGKMEPLVWPFVLLSNPTPDPIVSIGHRGSARATFALDPADVKRLLTIEEEIVLACRLGDSRSNQVTVEVLMDDENASQSSLSMAEYLYRRQDYDRALKIVQDEIASSPTTKVAAMSMLGQVYEAQGRLEDAMKAYLQALVEFDARRGASAPEDPEILLNKTQALAERQRKEASP